MMETMVPFPPEPPGPDPEPVHYFYRDVPTRDRCKNCGKAIVQDRWVTTNLGWVHKATASIYCTPDPPKATPRGSRR